MLFRSLRVCSYTDALIGRYSRTLIIRVNLYYYQTVQLRLRVERVFEDLDRLIAEHERNPIFNHLLGYICAVEQGDDRGYHIHAAYFFNGNEVCRDIHKAQQIGDLWVRTTQGQGYFDSCNQDKEKKYGKKKQSQEQEQEQEVEKQRELGIGMIFRKDEKVRPHVHYAMRYLVKDAQQVRLKPMRARCLRMGQTIR